MLDMTMTVVAGGKIEQKSIRGEQMPDGWVIDPQGAYVSDPMRYKEDPDNTGVLPLGGMQFGHKGYGLGMMVEMLVGPLSHAGCTTSASGTGGGVMILAINIDDFIDLASYEDEVEAAVKALTSMLEPAMIVIVGGIVGSILLAMYLPMFSVFENIQ